MGGHHCSGEVVRETSSGRACGVIDLGKTDLMAQALARNCRFDAFPMEQKESIRQHGRLPNA